MRTAMDTAALVADWPRASGKSRQRPWSRTRRSGGRTPRPSASRRSPSRRPATWRSSAPATPGSALPSRSPAPAATFRCSTRCGAGEGASSRNGGIASGNLRPAALADDPALRRSSAPSPCKPRPRPRARTSSSSSPRRASTATSSSPDASPAHRAPTSTTSCGARPRPSPARSASRPSRSIARTSATRSAPITTGAAWCAWTSAVCIRPSCWPACCAWRRRPAPTIHGETAVVRIVPAGGGFEVETACGKMRARDVIVATNGYTDAANPWLRRRLVPVASCIIATEPISANLMRTLMPKGYMCSETRKLHYYYRPSPDGRRILFGGRGGSLGDASAAATAAAEAGAGRHLSRARRHRRDPQLVRLRRHEPRHGPAHLLPRRHPLRGRLLRLRRGMGALGRPEGRAQRARRCAAAARRSIFARRARSPSTAASPGSCPQSSPGTSSSTASPPTAGDKGVSPSPRKRGERRGEGQRKTPRPAYVAAPHPSPLPVKDGEGDPGSTSCPTPSPSAGRSGANGRGR